MKATLRRVSAIGAAALLLSGLAACSSGNGASDSMDGATNWRTVTSVEEGGGMDALIAAAKKEGKLNAIALPKDWANYGEVISTFEKKYGVKVEVENPDASSQDEITAVSSRKGQERSPDVIDVGHDFDVAAAKQGLLAPYKVTSFGKIPDSQKEATGLWYNDMGGYVSIGCDAGRVAKCPTKFSELLDPQYKGKIALTGNPVESASAFGAVFAAALANGGSFDNIKPGIDFFAKLKQVGNFNPVEATPATMEKGETPIAVVWDYRNAAYSDELKAKGIEWKVAIPEDGVFAQYYSQAIVKWAPHPAAARLWQEFLYSTEGQNLWLKGYARPVLLPVMVADGTVDKSSLDRLPQVNEDKVSFPTEAQGQAAKTAVSNDWAKAVS
ncbi:putative spermidine/putrescine transport system substrate-binding protein [Saccharopolyspora shandongensis]|uniref:Putative spermidine/putrescine transport system substrate-binding protein n=2 Tax=Saccharopolyspora shandongensis TaxID=418495 RepID=A0A1H3HUV5_9PSEU|nr:putative spermidine/putrescine transport system substrate-binding protein [Saccharopolyspora shandongensis]